ncbi:Ataxin-2, C-terminal [Artemisia annua]|uniref:Ataxin-2, C-terminal n=1 Tax=Artemisia annua TaxID=35608 RepID=A0A2U1NT75_ARTAN|nr:Ataxin-2, C-terminal [Artemisia annua]
MAQANPEEKLQEKIETAKRNEKREITSPTSFKFNAQAPEFVPSSRTQSPVSGYFYPYFNYLGTGGNDGSGSADWIYASASDQDQQMHLFTNPNVLVTNYAKNVNVLTEDLQQKIIKQVEYQFSGLSLLANESLVKHISKDPEGYVPISVIASMKKIKSCINNNLLLAQALRSSSKLVVSSDGKKVRRKHPFTEKDKEELQLHALVEYETTEIAEKAVDKLNDERNWRKGFRVRLMVRRSPKSVLKTRKSDFDGLLDDDDDAYLSEESSQPNSATSEQAVDSNVEENSKKGWARGRGKSKSRTPTHISRGLLQLSPQTSSSVHLEASPTKQSPKGPRMPDGTRGFTMGRGKPILTGIP